MAALTVHLTATAERRLHEILDFIAEDNPDAAAKLAGRIEHSINRLASFPGSGRKIPEAPERQERELVIPPAVRIFYRVEGGALWILYATRSEQELDPGIIE
jgi:plasmid stabilization system protein ParE